MTGDAPTGNHSSTNEGVGAPRLGPWRTRGYFPHFDTTSRFQSITYRLFDALPREVLDALDESATRDHSDERRRRIESYLDAGHGGAWLQNASIAEDVVRVWMNRDGIAYELHAWIVMPNHVHVLARFSDLDAMPREVKAWKSVTARMINKRMGRSGRVWQREYWDRFVRDERHYRSVVQYIHDNPVKAGLVADAMDWPWSSVRKYQACEDSRLVGPAPSADEGVGAPGVGQPE